MYPTLKQYTKTRISQLADKHGVKRSEVIQDFTAEWSDYICRQWEEHGQTPTLRQWNAFPAYLKNRLRLTPRNMRTVPSPLGHLPYCAPNA